MLTFPEISLLNETSGHSYLLIKKCLRILNSVLTLLVIEATFQKFP